MKFRRYLLLFLLWPFAPIVQAQNKFPIVPMPLEVKSLPGNFILHAKTLISYPVMGTKAASSLQAFLADHGQPKLRPVLNKTNMTVKGGITLLHTNDQLPVEGYELRISTNGISIKGSEAGLFYGVQSLIQLMMDQSKLPIQLPCGVIKDSPRFAYRGFMLDVSRHFSTVHEVKQLLTQMARNKLNRFHWHLTDNQGWRIEIKKYPKLTGIGAKGNHSNPDAAGTFYTQAQIKEVVAFASNLNITVIPEIEMPAHAKAALAAYPELLCESANASALSPKAPHFTVFCPSEATFTFLKDVLAEIISLFPGKYIHIGGDEANKAPWKESTFAQKIIKDLDLKDEHGLQSYFIQRIEKFLNSKGKSIIGWDEILEGGLAPNATVMSWQGEQGGVAAAKQQHDVIMVPRTAGMYFDFPQSAAPEEKFIELLSTSQNVHNYNPIPTSLNVDEQKYILGVQANLWTERLPSRASREYMIYPRLFALAETAWSAQSRKSYEDFVNRSAKLMAYLDRNGINYRVPNAGTDTTIITSSINYTLKSPFRDAKIYYTLNGKTPTDRDEIYTGPITITVPVNGKIDLLAMVVTPYGRRSLISHTTFKNTTN